MAHRAVTLASAVANVLAGTDNGVTPMTRQTSTSADLRYATNEERRFALAHLRWLAGGTGGRGSKPSPTHKAYALSEARDERIQRDVEQMVRDAAQRLADHPT